MNIVERDELAEHVAQAVIERIEARERVNRLADRAMARYREQSKTANRHPSNSEDRLNNLNGAVEKTHSPFNGNRDNSLANSDPRIVRRVILRHFLSPGDVLMLTAAVRDLALSHPGRFLIDVRTSASALWEHNPYLTPLDDDDPLVETIHCDYPLIHRSNQTPYHFIHAFRLFLEERLGVTIEPHAFHGDIYLTDEEKSWISQVQEITGQIGERFWLIVSGGKTDFTAKWWDPSRCQQVVDHFAGRVQFVQVGERTDGHVHPPLNGVIDLVGKTDMRQMVRLMHHASGVVCPVTMMMHLAAAVETKPGRPQNRPCVVVAGGREPAQWEAYPHHQYLHVNGALPCCEEGGCWKSRVVPLGDGDEKDSSLCLLPVVQSDGLIIPSCLDMISATDVINAIERYLGFDEARLRLNKEDPSEASVCEEGNNAPGDQGRDEDGERELGAN